MAFDSWDLLLIIIGIVSFLYVYGWWEDGYFRRRHVKSLPARVPFVGHMLDVSLRKEHVMDMSLKHYNAFPDQKYIGVREFSSYVILVRDLEMIKQVTIKNFDHFEDHEDIFDERSDALIANNLFSLKGQKWREMRATMSPAFTSSKMKGMYEFIMECGYQMADYYREEMKKPENIERGFVETEMKDAFSRISNDVIATCAFGIKVNSLTDRDNLFHSMGREATDFSGIRIFHFMSATAPILRLLGIPVLTKRVTDFFSGIVSDTMKMREENNIVRPDLIQLLMAAKKGALEHKEGEAEENKDSGFATVEESSIGKKIEKRKWSDNELASQALAFFVAGFDTTSTLLCFMAHELMLNPDVQKKLQREIDHVVSEAHEKVTYSEVLGLKYLDMVVCETLRRWPPVVVLDRQCVSPYNLAPPCESSKHHYQMKPNDLLWIPVYGIHHDPQYFKNPYKFDPERFSDENKGEINSFAYMPFGIGPRNCIGSRFALMEAKTIIFFLLQKFDFVMTPKTQIPLELDNSSIFIQAKRGFWIGLKPRNS